jgi:hypothetical protein
MKESERQKEAISKLNIQRERERRKMKDCTSRRYNRFTTE